MMSGSYPAHGARPKGRRSEDIMTQPSGHASARSITIGGREVGPDAAPFIIAEMSGNHDGDLDKALAIVRATAQAGAHAIKLQTYTADTITIDVDGPQFRISSGHELWADRRLYDLYQEAHTPWEWHAPIFELAHELGLLAFSSPFDPTAVAFLQDLDVPCYKIASSEIVDLPLIRLAAGTGKPIIISTGMASVGEIDAAVRAARSTGNDQIIVLSCTASYPDELAALVRETQTARISLGRPRIGATVSETEGLRLRRSLFIVQDVVAGDVVTEANVRSIRPSGGLAPDLFGVVKGRTFRADAKMGTPLSWDVI